MKITFPETPYALAKWQTCLKHNCEEILKEQITKSPCNMKIYLLDFCSYQFFPTLIFVLTENQMWYNFKSLLFSTLLFFIAEVSKTPTHIHTWISDVLNINSLCKISFSLVRKLTKTNIICQAFHTLKLLGFWGTFPLTSYLNWS